MCGRFTQMMSWSEVLNLYHYQEPAAPQSLTPRHNGCTDPELRGLPARRGRPAHGGQTSLGVGAVLGQGCPDGLPIDQRAGGDGALQAVVPGPPSAHAVVWCRRTDGSSGGGTAATSNPTFWPWPTVLSCRSPGCGERWSGPKETRETFTIITTAAAPGTCRHPSPSTRHRRSRPIRRLARSVIVGDPAPRPGSGALRRPLREARRQHQGEQRQEQRSGHPGPGGRAAPVLKSMAKPQGRLRRPWRRHGSGGFLAAD